MAAALVASGSRPGRRSADQATRPASSTILGDTRFVVRAHRRNAARRARSPARAPASTSTGPRASPTSRTSTGCSRSARPTRSRSSARLACVRRIDADRRPVADRRPADGLPGQRRLAAGLRRHHGRREVQRRCRRPPDNGVGLRRPRGHQAARPPATTTASAPAARTSWSTASSARKSTRSSTSSGFGGFKFRGSPDDYELSNGFRYGFGVGYPEPRQPEGDWRGERRVSTSTTPSTSPARRTWSSAARRHRGTSTARSTSSSAPTISRQRVLLRRRLELSDHQPTPTDRGRPQRARTRRRHAGHPGPHRLPPRRARLGAAAAAAPAASPTAARRPTGRRR